MTGNQLSAEWCSNVVHTCACHSGGEVTGHAPPPGTCNPADSPPCCDQGLVYEIYDCSPPVSNHTKANPTLQSFDHGGDGSPPAECDGQYHNDDELVVALSTGWYDNGNRCLDFINIRGNGRRVRAKVVDECVSSGGCDETHYYKQPCGNTIIRATKADWSALGVSETQWDTMDVLWSDA
ncbi:hypothetical protein V6N11_066122 [Hibiscus sabdariffa]|uniref:Uncharacterized protein n=2 Tax=Hibiscus sabdariffa TaxID=183260 RepID=A0ABR2NV06_9ROSI